MGRPGKLTDEEARKRIEALPGWVLKDGKLHRTFVFKDFVEAFGFMTELAREAEPLNHHPEWFNVYNRVTMDLVTHDPPGITALDFELPGHRRFGRRWQPGDDRRDRRLPPSRHRPAWALARWPKFTGGWLVASPAVGDIDGDGLLEVVVNTREGQLYVWDTSGPTHVGGRPSVQWQKFRHDLWNTGNFHTPLPQQRPR